MSYKVLREIGRGGFGVVEEVEDDDGEIFARKRFLPAPHNLPHSPEEKKTVLDRLRKRFVREVKTQQHLSGPEIIEVVETELTSDEPWFTMPLAEKTYEQQIQEDKDSGVVSIEAVADIINGLQYLHEMGYVHRDLNPKNILLQGGNWKLTDFGAVLPPSDQTITLTEQTTIYTERYCSPEQRSEFHNAQPASDVYSFGCVLHDLVSDQTRVPYSKHTCDGKIGVIIEKCTDTNPKKRPNISKLRDLVLEALLEAGGHYSQDDPKSEEWLSEMAGIADWDDAKFEQFLRFFLTLDSDARTEAHSSSSYVGILSTPFITLLRSPILSTIAERQDGLSEAIIEKYCDWVCGTKFKFGFSDSIGSRLAALFDKGTPADKALCFAALVRLGASHNRWFVMRTALSRCGSETPENLAKRFAVELKVQSLESSLRACVNEVKWDKGKLSSEIAALL
ncbi:MAG: protein kinase [Planctomycetota bacterium]